MVKEEILYEIIERLEGNEYPEDIVIEHEGKKYRLKDVSDDDWEDCGSDGKYSSKNEMWKLYLEENKEEELKIFFTRLVTRTGSYYTDWYYDYDGVKVLQSYEEVVPEQIIPAHTVTKYKQIAL